ncbi:8075_t:CDS:2, partial [Racocetra fulgida]
MTLVSVRSKQLETSLKKYSVKCFDFSEFSDLVTVGGGGYGVVYSATFQGQTYALKSLNNNLNFGDKEFKQFKREVSEPDKINLERKPEAQNDINIVLYILDHLVLSSEPDEINLEQKSEVLNSLETQNDINIVLYMLDHLVLNSESDKINLEQKLEETQNDINIVLHILDHLVLSSEPDDINSEQKNNVNYKPKPEENIIAVADVTEEITKEVYTSNVIKSRENISCYTYYTPIIATISGLIKEIIKIYEKAQFNKKICNSLLDRAKSAEAAMNTLQRRKHENEEKF